MKTRVLKEEKERGGEFPFLTQTGALEVVQSLSGFNEQVCFVPR